MKVGHRRAGGQLPARVGPHGHDARDGLLPAHRTARLVDGTGNDAQTGVLEAGFGAVREGDPTGQLNRGFAFRQAGDIVRFPAQPASQIAERQVFGPGAIAGDVEHQGRTGPQVGRSVVKGDSANIQRSDAAVHTDERLPALGP